MKSNVLDVIGGSAAVLCLIHCIAFPILMIFPFGISHNPYIDLVFLSIGTVVVYRVTRKNTTKWLNILLWLSVALITVSVMSDLIFEVHLPLIYVGALGLIAGHVINFKSHKH